MEAMGLSRIPGPQRHQPVPCEGRADDPIPAGDPVGGQ